MPAKLPRVAPGSRFVLSGSMWNELCDRIERCEALTVAQGGPLEMLEGGAGKVLAAKWGMGRPIVRVKVTAVDPGGITDLVLVRRFNGTALTGDPFAIEKTTAHAVDDETYAYQPVGGVEGNPTYLSKPVTWQEVAPIGGLDAMEQGTVTVEGTPFLNLPTTRGTDDLLQFVPETIDSRDGVSLVLKDPGGAGAKYKVPQWNGGTYVLDWIRARA